MYKTRIVITTDFLLTEHQASFLATIANSLFDKELRRMRKAYQLEQDNLSDKKISELVESVSGEKIRELRQAKGWTLDDLADKVGIGRSAMCHLEKRERGKFQLKTLIRIMNILDPNFFHGK